MAFTNPNPNLHIDLLKSQYAIFSTIADRLFKSTNYLTLLQATHLRQELLYLERIIKQKENESRR